MKFWSALTRALLIFAVLIWVALAAWDRLVPYGKPIDDLQALDGCYEGEGLPDFMRPPRHWIFFIDHGVILDRDGRHISRIRFAGTKANMTVVVFSPGILITGKPSTVQSGDTFAGKAFVRRSIISIALEDDWGNVMQKTSCS